MKNISWGEIALTVFVIYIFFGVKIIPKLIRNIREFIVNLQRAAHEIRKEMNHE